MTDHFFRYSQNDTSRTTNFVPGLLVFSTFVSELVLCVGKSTKPTKVVEEERAQQHVLLVVEIAVKWQPIYEDPIQQGTFKGSVLFPASASQPWIFFWDPIQIPIGPKSAQLLRSDGIWAIQVRTQHVLFPSKPNPVGRASRGLSFFSHLAPLQGVCCQLQGCLKCYYQSFMPQPCFEPPFYPAANDLHPFGLGFISHIVGCQAKTMQEITHCHPDCMVHSD